MNFIIAIFSKSKKSVFIKKLKNLIAFSTFFRNCFNWIYFKNPPHCSINVFELKQTLSLVYNSELILKQNLNEQTMWSFQSLFNQKIDSICPVADVSKIYMDLGATGVRHNNNFLVLLTILR